MAHASFCTLETERDHFVGEKNSFHRHLEWLLERGQNRKPEMICPQCGARIVEFFSLLFGHGGDFSIGSHFTCCNNEGCKEILWDMACDKTPTFIPFEFSVQMRHNFRIDRRRVVGLFKEVFQLPRPLTRDAAFAFFKKD